MDTTLIVYEKQTRTAGMCELISQVLGPAVRKQPQEFDGKFDSHSAVVIVFAHEQGNLPPDTARFIEENGAQLQVKKVALVCISGNRAAAARALKTAAHKLSGNVAFSVRIPLNSSQNAEMKSLNHTVSDETADKLILLKRALRNVPDIPADMLMYRVEQILESHNTCALCTGHDGGIRATPIEYVYRNGVLYFLSEGGEKFAHIYANPQVSLTVFDAYSGFDKLESVQIEGTAIMVETFCNEYNGIIESKGLSSESLRKLPVILSMFKVMPKRIEILESAFAKTGYAVKQVLEKKT